MFGYEDAERVAAAQGVLDYAVTALAHAHCPGWKGSAAEAADQMRVELATLGSDLYRQLHVLRLEIEEIALLRSTLLSQAACSVTTGGGW